jgi:hypothetical protein
MPCRAERCALGGLHRLASSAAGDNSRARGEQGGWSPIAVAIESRGNSPIGCGATRNLLRPWEIRLRDEPKRAAAGLSALHSRRICPAQAVLLQEIRGLLGRGARGEWCRGFLLRGSYFKNTILLHTQHARVAEKSVVSFPRLNCFPNSRNSRVVCICMYMCMYITIKLE